MQARQSLEGLEICIYATRGLAYDVVRRMFDNPVWKNLRLLCSLILRVRSHGDATTAVRQLSSLSVSHGS